MEIERRQRTNRLRFYAPYPKQLEFHASDKRERLFMAGNQLGKTLAGAAEMSCHLTGRYPPWWKGRVFDHPIISLAGSESSELTRDGVQRLLVGPPDREEEWGTGFIPKDAITGTNRRQGVPNALDSVTVRHSSGGFSTLYFKSYDQGRTKWQAATVDFVWFDEEPPEDVYFEGITRTNATQGSIMVTFTPLKGMSRVVERFLLQQSPDRGITAMTIDDAAHYSPEERERIKASYPDHEREARTMGTPSLGSGAIFPVVAESITVDPFPVPQYWPRLGAMDFGWDHPFAAVELAWDRDNDVIYVLRCFRESRQTPAIHCATLRTWGDLRWSWPHDGLQHSKDSGEPLAEQYGKHGLKMLTERSQFPDGSSGVEAGLLDMLDRMQTGRLKVLRQNAQWFEEFRLYHRKDGKVVKERDDLMSATRYGVMDIRHARMAGRKPVVQHQGASGYRVHAGGYR